MTVTIHKHKTFHEKMNQYKAEKKFNGGVELSRAFVAVTKERDELLAACKAAQGYMMPYADSSAPNSPDKKVFEMLNAAIANVGQARLSPTKGKGL